MALTPFFSGFDDWMTPMNDPMSMMNYDPISSMMVPRTRQIHDLEALAAAPVTHVRDEGNLFNLSLKPPPGIDKNELHVNLDRDVLTIQGEHKEQKQEAGQTRWNVRRFTRSFRIPESVDQHNIQAKWTTDGLNLHLPKKAGFLENGRRISIEGVDQQAAEKSSGMGMSGTSGMGGTSGTSGMGGMGSTSGGMASKHTGSSPMQTESTKAGATHQ